jgi:glucose dehydrogenase
MQIAGHGSPFDQHSGFHISFQWLHRGVAYWRSGDDERIVMLTAFAQMIALDAKTGKPIPTFGADGRIDLTQGMRRPVDRDYYTVSSPPVIVRNIIVVGSSVMDWWGHRPSPPGDVRGFDLVTGRLLWTFHPWRKAASPASRPGRRIPSYCVSCSCESHSLKSLRPRSSLLLGRWYQSRKARAKCEQAARSRRS